MLSFTAAGAVSRPTTLQIRIGRHDPGALRAAAPTPTRDLTAAEVRANVRHFTVGQRGPRTQPCDRLVLSGPVEDPALVDAIAEARGEGIATIVLHGRSPVLEPGVDRVAIRVRQPVEDPPRIPWNAVIPLYVGVVDRLDPIVRSLIAVRPDRAVLMWPFPGEDAVGDLPAAVTCARRALETLSAAGVPAVLKGLPPCLDGSDEGRMLNRWYVDADHQQERALHFVPDIVQYLKPDSCRACLHSPRCDGVVRGWLERGNVGPLQPATR